MQAHALTRISSLQNKQVKAIARLNKRRYRDAQQVTVVEGGREVMRALASRLAPREAYICPELVTEADALAAIDRLHRLSQAGFTRLYEVTAEVFDRIAYRGHSGGVLLVMPYLAANLADLPAEASLLTIIENVEKPGNVGAVLRTADGAGADGVIVASSGPRTGTDLHNPNVIRASLGTLYSVPVATATSERVIAWLQGQGTAIVVATPGAGTRYSDVDLTGPVALVTGSEAQGVGPGWHAAADHLVTIPMAGTADSLNVAIATALLLYEAVRQRDLDRDRHR